ncbi:geranylgeranyl reductase family protein [Shimia sp. Alg240-R146]|uniref:geranylgeranyl reductase family protein n=1 Tax=Shimia sp. Alg240-R146 TaxID=2993449 RepID=UPI0022E5CE4B|nr:geranylgeranyl reductase family protein [Shimia sp. Alg240-R146]
MSDFDIIVIGAGPAGSAAATWAAKHGARVALVDKATFPRNKLCGGLFTERSRSHYREIFGQDFDLSKSVTRHDIAFWQAGAELAVLRDIPPLHLTMRLDLDDTLFRHALDAGAVDFSGRPIAQISDNAVTFKDGNALSAPILIGTDGVNSIVAKHLFGAAFNTETIGFGLEIEVPEATQNPNENQLRIDFSALTWGYGWSFPKQQCTTVGVGGLRAPNPDIKVQMRHYIETLGLDPDAIKFKGHHLPFGDFRKTPGRANIVLAGDAAGLVDPITGEGIAFAMKSGQIAAQAALDALAAGAPETTLARHKMGLRDMHKNLRIARTLRRIIFAPRWQRTFTETFRRSETVRAMYMRLLAGEMEYPQLARAVAARLPRYVANAFRR